MTEHDPADCGLGGAEAGLRPEFHDLTLLDQSPASPHRALEWRWIVAAFLARTGSRTRLRWIDGPVRRAARFLRQAARPAKSGRSRPPGVDLAIARAESLRSGPAHATRSAVEALLLAGLDDRAIAAEVGLSPDVVDCFHGLFFDVRPILRALRCRPGQGVRRRPLHPGPRRHAGGPAAVLHRRAIRRPGPRRGGGPPLVDRRRGRPR